VQWLLEHVHIYSGLPWSLSIIATTLLVRVGVFYFYIRQADTAARTAALSPIVKPLNEKMLEHMRAGNQQAAMTYRKQISAVYKDADIHPFKAALGPLLQAMLGFGAFRLIRGMADLPVPGLQNEGLLWIADLTISDPYLILPVAVGGMMHLVVRVRTHLPQPLSSTYNTAPFSTIR
jgi:YidC/Oxa1 family membrane protein insertase